MILLKNGAGRAAPLPLTARLAPTATSAAHFETLPTFGESAT